MTFTKSTFRHASAACDRIAGQITRAVTAMGLHASIDSSSVSASTYVYVSHREDDDFESIKIRVSDHADRYGDSDYRVYCDERAASATGDGAWFEAIAWLSECTGRPIPPTAKIAITRARKAAEIKAAAEAKAKEQWQRREALHQAREAAIIATNPERWTELVAMGSAGKEKRRLFRRAAEKALGLSGPWSFNNNWSAPTDDKPVFVPAHGLALAPEPEAPSAGEELEKAMVFSSLMAALDVPQPMSEAVEQLHHGLDIVEQAADPMPQKPGISISPQGFRSQDANQPRHGVKI